MTEFSRLSALWASFYSRDLYRDVVTRWKGIGLVYLLLLLSLSWLPSMVRWFAGVGGFAAAAERTVVPQLPAISIKDGVMTANPPGPRVVPFGAKRGSDEGLIIIDDTVDSVPADLNLSVDAFVLTRREAGVIRPSRHERRIWTLSGDFDVTPRDVSAFLSALPFLVPPIGYVGAVAGSVVFRLLQALLYGALSVAFAKRQRVTLEYAAAVRLATVAVTPVVVIRTLLWFGASDPAWYLRWPLALLMTLGYLAFGVRALAAPSPDAAQRQTI